MHEDKISTRARILDACRILFNERGPREVTTSEIAQAVGISEGNLHYHFRRKEQIVIALFQQFEAALDNVAIYRAEAHREGISAWFNLMWEWRLFYGAGVYRFAPVLEPRLKSLADRGQASVRQCLLEMVSRGELAAGPDEIDRLVVNSWIISTYWIDYLRTRQGVQVITRDHLRWGYAQVEALFERYLAVSAQPLRTAG